MNQRIFVPLLFLITFTNVSKAQFSWRINGEAGYFKTNTIDQSIKNDLLAQFNGQLKYSFTDSFRQASINLHFHPAIFGLENKISVFKLKTNGDYYHFFDDFNLGVNFSVFKNNYHGNGFDIKYDIFQIQSLLITRVFNAPLTSTIGYAYQNIDFGATRIYDLLYVEINHDQHLSPFFKYGYGSYIETFSIENKTNFGNSQNRNNSGLRVGPIVNLKYLKSFLLNVDYRFLFHFSQITDNLSYEQWIRIIAGKVFFSDFSIFFLTDFYFRDLNKKESIENIGSLYTPINQENKYYLKFGYELTERNDIYFRFGYSKENLDEFINNISGWSFTLGFELR